MGILSLRISDKAMVLFTIISNERGRDRMLFQPSLYFDTEDLVRKTVIICFVARYHEFTMGRGRREDWRNLLGIGDLSVILSQRNLWKGEAYARKSHMKNAWSDYRTFMLEK